MAKPKLQPSLSAGKKPPLQKPPTTTARQDTSSKMDVDAAIDHSDFDTSRPPPAKKPVTLNPSAPLRLTLKDVLVDEASELLLEKDAIMRPKSQRTAHVKHSITSPTKGQKEASRIHPAIPTERQDASSSKVDVDMVLDEHLNTARLKVPSTKKTTSPQNLADATRRHALPEEMEAIVADQAGRRLPSQILSRRVGERAENPIDLSMETS
ncbi:hypothetical protein EXIGLDRAFT_745709, partial [Exidia glandulosa HHB12029]